MKTTTETQTLRNKPLVEAILEVRWGKRLSPGDPTPPPPDPNYRLLLGRFSVKVERDYPSSESLPSSTLPDEMCPQIAQYRFRAKPAGWPLIQLGPGVMTVNETDAYRWPDFRDRCKAAFAWLLESYPSPSSIGATNVILRYIDAVSFDYTNEDVFRFLKDKMKVSLGLPEGLFTATNVSQKPAHFNAQISFANSEPPGTMTLRFATVLRGGRPALLWETVFESALQESPKLQAGFQEWLEGAHGIVHTWFFKLIEGDLEGSFR